MTLRQIGQLVLMSALWGAESRSVKNSELLQKCGNLLRSRTFEEESSERFGVNPPENINENHNLVIVASELDSSTERIIDYLSTRFGVPINAVFFRYFEEGDGDYLVRSWLKDPNQVETQASKVLSSKSGKEP
jgi:hypothetical protein